MDDQILDFVHFFSLRELLTVVRKGEIIHVEFWIGLIFSDSFGLVAARANRSTIRTNTVV